MSKFEDYDYVSKHYDSYRMAPNVDFLAAVLSAYLEKPLGEIHVLDAGCGTGNFSKELLDRNVGKVSMVDASLGMLQVAKSKVAYYEKLGRVDRITQHTLPTFPFNKNEFDAVIAVQVLHHLDTAENDYRNVKEFFKSANRILKVGGVLLINYSSREQLKNLNWYSHLIRKASEEMGNRLPTREEFFKALDEAKFGNISEFTCFDGNFLTSSSARPKNGLRDADWRKQVSMWKLAEQTNELEEAFKKYDEIMKTTCLESLIEEHWQKYQSLGQATNLFARKIQ